MFDRRPATGESRTDRNARWRSNVMTTLLLAVLAALAAVVIGLELYGLIAAADPASWGGKP